MRMTNKHSNVGQKWSQRCGFITSSHSKKEGGCSVLGGRDDMQGGAAIVMLVGF